MPGILRLGGSLASYGTVVAPPLTMDAWVQNLNLDSSLTTSYSGPELTGFDEFAELPQVVISTVMPVVNGTTFTVNGGGNLQTAINSAAAADGNLTHEIVVEAGQTFVGNFTLPNKSGSNPTGTGWIIVRSSLSANLPEGTRAGPADIADMPTVRTNTSTQVITANDSSHHYRFVGIHFTCLSGTSPTDLIRWGPGSTVPAMPHHMMIDRCYIHGNVGQSLRRGVSLNCAEASVIDSSVTECHSGQDAQSVSGYAGTGPYLIENNWLEASTENIIFGGADPTITDVVPADITIRGNYFTKQTGWKGVWSIKNLLELKNATRVLVENNILEGMWNGGQEYAVNIKGVNQDGGTGAWSKCTDVTFRYNIFRSCTNAFVMSADAEPPVAEGLRRISFHDNLTYDVGDYNGDVGGTMLLLQSAVTEALEDMTFKNNTFVHSATAINAIYFIHNVTGVNIEFENNIITLGTSGFNGDAVSVKGTEAFAEAWTSYTCTGNVLVGSYTPANYPPGNTAAANTAAVFSNPAADNYTPIGVAVGKGCNYTEVLARTANVISGIT